MEEHFLSIEAMRFDKGNLDERLNKHPFDEKRGVDLIRWRPWECDAGA